MNAPLEAASELDDHSRNVLRLINRAVSTTGAAVEGNLFYHHQTRLTEDMQPDITRLHKRRNFILAIAHAGNFLEIGFNAGHSALLALSRLPNLHYIGVDIGEYSYTRPCASIIEESFPGRARIIIADSRLELPRMSLSGDPQVDAVHVDGGHDELTALLDILHALLITRSGGIVLVDDTLHPPVRAAVDYALSAGFAVPETFGGTWTGEESLALRVASHPSGPPHSGT
jgi:predicted O-methyltransferase YrrM